MLKYIMAHDSKESIVVVIQLLEVCVLYGVNELLLDCIVHCFHIFVDSLYFILLKLELVSVVRGGILWYHGLYSLIRQVGPRND